MKGINLEKIALPSSPLMAVPPADTPDVQPSPVPGAVRTEPADIPEPTVPASLATALQEPLHGTVPVLPDALLPLAHGFCQYVQAQLTAQLTDAGIKMARDVDKTITAMGDYTKGVLAT